MGKGLSRRCYGLLSRRHCNTHSNLLLASSPQNDPLWLLLLGRSQPDNPRDVIFRAIMVRLCLAMVLYLDAFTDVLP